MRYSMLSYSAFLCVILWLSLTLAGQVDGRSCPCSNPDYCHSVTKQYQHEIFVFSLSKQNWKLYDWSKITSIVQVGYQDDSLMCHAHALGVRVILIANFPEKQLTNETARAEWVSQTVKHVEDNFLDGVNVDFESAIPRDQILFINGLTKLMAELRQAAPSILQVTLDVAWSPACIDDRCFDYKALSKFCDFLFVMSYDERSQFRRPCVAGPNSAFNLTLTGLNQYLQLGIPRKKLVLGQPWYGYKYPCLNQSKVEEGCPIKPISFRHSECSDAAGRETDYSTIMEKLLPLAPSGEQWSQAAQAPYFSYKDNGSLYQVWFDNERSLRLKYGLARTAGLRGVGMWNADAVDYSDTPTGRAQREQFWGALPSY